jgi:hypothetical protein
MMELLRTTAAISAPLLISAGYCIGLSCLGLCGLSAVGLSRARWPAVPISLFLGVACALGSGLAATLWLVFSFVGLFMAPIVLAILVAAIAFNVIVNGAVGRELASAFWRLMLGFRAEHWSWQLIALAVVALLAAHGVCALHPAIGDSVAFYLPWARVIAATGQVVALPGYESFSDIWTIAEIQIAAIMMFASDFAAKALPFWHTIFAAVLLWGAARSARLELRGCILAVAMLFTSSAVSFIVRFGKTDLVALPIGLAVLIVAALKDDAHAKRQSMIIGLLAGAAVAAKLSYLPVLGVGIVVISCWHAWESFRTGNRSWRPFANEEVQSLLIIAASGTLILAPQMIRNWVMSSEPFAPLYYFRNVGFGLEQNWFNAATTRRILLTYPFAMTFGNYWGQIGNVSLLAWAFFPLCLVFAKNQSRVFWLLSAAATGGILVWALLRTSTLAPRYILCSLALFFVFIAGIAERASRSGPPLVKALVVGMTAYTVCASVNLLVPVLDTSIRYARTGDIESYNGEDEYAVARLLNAIAPPGTPLAMLDYYRYPLRADLLLCLIGAGELAAGDSLENFYVNGARYMVIDRSDPVFFKVRIAAIMKDVPSWLQMKEIYHGSRLTVLKLSSSGDAPVVRFHCKKSGNGWQRKAID